MIRRWGSWEVVAVWSVSHAIVAHTPPRVRLVEDNGTFQNPESSVWCQPAWVQMWESYLPSLPFSFLVC